MGLGYIRFSGEDRIGHCGYWIRGIISVSLDAFVEDDRNPPYGWALP